MADKPSEHAGLGLPFLSESDVTTVALPKYSTERFYMLSTMESHPNFELRQIPLAAWQTEFKREPPPQNRTKTLYLIHRSRGPFSPEVVDLIEVLEPQHIVMDLALPSAALTSHADLLVAAREYSLNIIPQLPQAVTFQMRFGVTIGVSSTAAVFPGLSHLCASIEKAPRNLPVYCLREDLAFVANCEAEADAKRDVDQSLLQMLQTLPKLMQSVPEPLDPTSQYFDPNAHDVIGNAIVIAIVIVVFVAWGASELAKAYGY